MNAYNILDIPEDSDERQVKKAYFAAVKKYPPDTDPDGFKRIREAYEAILRGEGKSSAENEKQLAADALYDQAMGATDEYDYDEALVFLKRALEFVPDSFKIIKSIGVTYMNNENYGLAVNHYKKYHELYPDDIEITAAYGYSLVKRGWLKKARPVLVQCVEKGFYNDDTKDGIIDYCSKSHDYQSFLDIVKDSKLYLYLDMCKRVTYGKIPYTKKQLAEYFKAHNMSTDDIICMFDEFSLDKLELYPCMTDIMTAYETASPDESKSFKFVKKCYDMEFGMLMYVSMNNWDASLTEKTIRKNILAVANCIRVYEFEERKSFTDPHDAELEFDVMFAQLRLIDSCQKVKLGLNCLQGEYPYLWRYMKDIIEQIQNSGNTAKLHDKFLINKIKTASPEFMKVAEEHIPRDELEYIKMMAKAPETVRGVKKIPPNSPCPCGSGKKYKKCCGRNA